jgi:hypothetical protein
MPKTFEEKLIELDPVSYSDYNRGRNRQKFISALESSLDIRNENEANDWLRDLFQRIRGSVFPSKVTPEEVPTPTPTPTPFIEPEPPKTLGSEVFNALQYQNVEQFLKENLWGGSDLIKLPETKEPIDIKPLTDTTIGKLGSMALNKIRSVGQKALELYFPESKKLKPLEEYTTFERIEELALAGALSGLFIPGIHEAVHERIKEPQKLWEKVVFGATEIASFLASFLPIKIFTAAKFGLSFLRAASAAERSAIIAKTLPVLETRFPKVTNFIFQGEKFEDYLAKTLELGTAFGIHTQLALPISSDLKDRLYSLANAYITAPLFVTTSLMKNPVSLISSNFALGSSMSALQSYLATGEVDKEDAIIQGSIFAALAAAGIVRLGEAKNKLRQAFVDKASQVIEKTIDETPPSPQNIINKELLRVLRETPEKGEKLYFLSFEKPLEEIEKSAFVKMRDFVERGDHVGAANHITEVIDSVIKFIPNHENVKYYPAAGNYFGGTEGSAMVVFKNNPTLEYFLLELAKRGIQETALKVDFGIGRGVKREHPVLFVEFERNLSYAEAKRVGEEIFNKYGVEVFEEGKKMEGSRIPGASIPLDSNILIYAYAPAFADVNPRTNQKYTPQEIAEIMDEIPNFLRSKGFPVKKHEIIYGQSTVYGKPRLSYKDETFTSRQTALRRDYKDTIWGEYGTEENFFRRVSEVFERRGFINVPWEVPKRRVIGLANIVKENVDNAVARRLEKISPDVFLSKIIDSQTRTAEQIEEVLKDFGIRKGSKDVNDSRYADWKEAYAEMATQVLDERELFGGVGEKAYDLETGKVGSGWTIEKFKTKYPVGSPLTQKQLNERLEENSAWILEALLSNGELWVDKLSPNEKRILLKRYFGTAKEGLNYVREIKSAYERGEDLGKFVLKPKFSEEEITEFKNILNKFIKNGDSSEAGLVEAITGKRNGYPQANRWARRFGFENIHAFYSELENTFPKTFGEINVLKASGDIVNAEIKDRIQYEFRTSGDFPAPDDAEIFRRKKNEIISTASTEEKLMGRKEILEELSDALGNVVFKNPQLPKKVKGRTTLDKYVEKQEESATVELHEHAHALNGRYKIIESLAPEFKETILDELLPLMKGLDLKGKTLDEKLAEGFSQFFSRYILLGDTEKATPLMHDFFESLMKAKSPDNLESIQRARNRFEALRKADALAALQTEIASKEEESMWRIAKKHWKNPVRLAKELGKEIGGRIKEFYRNELNVYADAWDIDKIYGLDLDKGVYLDIFTMSNRQRGMLGFLTTKGFPNIEDYKNWVPSPRTFGEAYADLYRGLHVSQIEILSSYRIAKEDMRRAKAFRKAGLDYPRNPLLAYGRDVDAIRKARERFPEVDKYAKRFEQHFDNVRLLARDFGLLSNEELSRLMENPMLAHLSRMPVGINDFESFTNFLNTFEKKISGSKSAFQDPLWTDLAELTYLAHRGVENLTLQKLGKIVEERGNIPGLVERVRPDVFPHEVKPEEIIRWVRAYWPDIPEKWVDKIKMEMEANPDIVAKLWRPAHFNDENRLIAYYENGQRKVLRLSPRLYDIFRNPRGRHLKGAAWDLAYNYIRLKRALATTLSLNFSFRNFLRDTFTQFILADKWIFPVWNSVEGMQHIVNKTKVFDAAMLYGIYGSGVVSGDVNELYRSLRQANVKYKANKFGLLFDWIQNFSENIELSSRLGLLSKYDINNRLEFKKGILDALNATFPWNQRGLSTSLVSHINSYWVPFFKPNLIVTEHNVKALTEHTFRTIARLSPFILLSLWLDERLKDNPDFQSLPAWRRYFFLNIPVEGKVVSLPFVGSVFSSILGSVRFVRDNLERKHNDPFLAKEFYKMAMEQLAPFGAESFVPSIVAPIVETAFNQNLYLGMPIVPDYLKNLPPELQYDKFTSDYAILISRGLKNLGINIAPLQVEHLLRGYLISFADYMEGMINWTLDFTGTPINEYRKQFDLLNLPGVGVFIAKEYGPQSAMEVRSLSMRFKALDSVYKGFQSLLKTDPSKAAQYYQENTFELQYYPVVKSLYQNQQKLIALYRSIEARKDIHPDVKESYLKNIKEQILLYSQFANDMLAQLETKQ